MAQLLALNNNSIIYVTNDQEIGPVLFLFFFSLFLSFALSVEPFFGSKVFHHIHAGRLLSFFIVWGMIKNGELFIRHIDI